MEELIKRLERVIATGAPDKNGQHPISAEVVLEVVKAQLSTNLAGVGTDCISREQAIEAVRMVIGDNRSISVCDAIKQLPPIKPKKGKWIKTARWGRVYYCDQCRNYLDFDGVNAGRGSTNFCPNCGAKMEVNNESN